MTETRKDVGQLGTCNGLHNRLEFRGRSGKPHAKTKKCIDWEPISREPLPQPGETIEKRRTAIIESLVTAGMERSWAERNIKEFARLIEQETARKCSEKISNWFDEWRPCDCGAESGSEYSTECGHAMNCTQYDASELRAAIRAEFGLKE